MNKHCMQNEVYAMSEKKRRRKKVCEAQICKAKFKVWTFFSSFILSATRARHMDDVITRMCLFFLSWKKQMHNILWYFFLFFLFLTRRINNSSKRIKCEISIMFSFSLFLFLFFFFGWLDKQLNDGNKQNRAV